METRFALESPGYAILDLEQPLVARTICIANQKGGVGKTTTAINLAVGLARGGHRTLLVDLDPQCNATSGLGFPPVDDHPLVSDRLAPPSPLLGTTEGLAVLPGSRRFSDVRLLADDESTTTTVLSRLRQLAVDFEFVLLDCPPTLGRLAELALAASQEVLMPIQCEYFAMEGLTQMIQLIKQVMQQPGQQLGFAGILLTMYDHTLQLTLEVDREVREFFGEIVFETVIPRDVAVSEASSHGQAVMDYAPRSRGARAYIELCMEVMER